MSRFEQLVQRVLKHLCSDPQMQDLRFCSAYPSSPRPNPLSQLLCVVGLSSVALEGGALGGYIGAFTEGGEYFGSRAEVCVSILIHSPPSLGAAACYSALSRICSRMMDGTLSGVLSVSGEKVSYDGSCGAFLLECTARLRGYWGQGDSGPAVRRITVKGEGL